MRILVCCEHLGVVGGVETYLRALLPGLLARGHQIALLVVNPAQSNIDTIHIDCPHSPVWFASDYQEAINWKPDVCYQHGMPKTSVEHELASRFPSVLYCHNYQGTCISGTKCQGSPSFQPCERPLGLSCLALYFPKRCGGLNPIKMVQLYRQQCQRRDGFHDHRALLVASHAMAAELIRNGVPAENVQLVPLFPPELEPDPMPPAPKPLQHRILFLGRFIELKGWMDALMAVPYAAKLLNRPLKLVVAGDGPDRQAFETEASRRGVDTEFLGWQGASARLKQMRAADLLLVPSVWPEPFGLVGIEAGCVGLPAVGYAVGGIPDWLKPGISGELAPGQIPNPDELADAVVRAIGDESHWQKLRVGAWETAKSFTLQKHLDQLEAVLMSAAHIQ